MTKLCLSICCLFMVLHANAQEQKWQYGIGLDVFVADLVHIENPPSTTIKDKNYGAVIPHLQVGRKLNEKWTIAAGLGFIRHKSSFRFTNDQDALVNTMEYLVVPVSVQYKLLNWGGHKSWKLEGAAWNKLLIYHESNLPDLTPYLFYIYPRFNSYVFNARLATSVEWNLNNQHSVSVTGFVSRDVTAYLNKHSVLDYIQPSRYLFGGLGLSYIF